MATQLRSRPLTTVSSEGRTPAINASLESTLGHTCKLHTCHSSHVHIKGAHNRYTGEALILDVTSEEPHQGEYAGVAHKKNFPRDELALTRRVTQFRSSKTPSGSEPAICRHPPTMPNSWGRTQPRLFINERFYTVLNAGQTCLTPAIQTVVSWST